MADLVFQTYDRFNAVYEVLSMLNEGKMKEADLASALNLPIEVVQELVSFIFYQGFAKASQSERELRITVLGCNFLKEFEGMKKFLS